MFYQTKQLKVSVYEQLMMLRVSDNGVVFIVCACVYNQSFVFLASGSSTASQLVRSKSTSNLTAGQNARAQTATLSRAPSTSLRPQTSSTVNRPSQFYSFFFLYLYYKGNS